jgi:hypothetical protein
LKLETSPVAILFGPEQGPLGERLVREAWDEAGLKHYQRLLVIGFGIDLHNGEQHEYVPDFLIRLARARDHFLILEPKGYDPLQDVKRAAAERWCAAVNAYGGFGHWQYRVIKRPEEANAVLDGLA